MKKTLFLLFASLGMLVTSCSKNNDTPDPTGDLPSLIGERTSTVEKAFLEAGYTATQVTSTVSSTPRIAYIRGNDLCALESEDEQVIVLVHLVKTAPDSSNDLVSLFEKGAAAAKVQYNVSFQTGNLIIAGEAKERDYDTPALFFVDLAATAIGKIESASLNTSDPISSNARVVMGLGYGQLIVAGKTEAYFGATFMDRAVM